MEEKGTMHVHLLTELTGNLYSEESEWEEDWSESDEYGMPLDGTELADYQPLVVDRIMVKHIVPLEKHRVGHKIIIDGIVSHLDRRVFHDGIQVHGLRVACAWIYLFHYDVLFLIVFIFQINDRKQAE